MRDHRDRPTFRRYEGNRRWWYVLAAFIATMFLIVIAIFLFGVVMLRSGY